MEDYFVMISTMKNSIFFEKKIVDFSQKAGRSHLPWRNPRKVSPRGEKEITAYEVWVSEIMLQQTQVNRVIEYYTRFLKRFPTVESLAKASWEDFLPYYQGLGYYMRGRNMLLTAKKVVKEYDGKFPRDKKLLEGLPGIGPYTASAIMSFAYGDNHLAWDTNLKRVIGRFFLGGKHLISDESMWENTFQAPKKVLNGALMDFGASLCIARPKCEACMLRSKCVYYREKGRQESRIMNQELRIKKKKENWKDASVYVFLHEKHAKYYSSQKKSFHPFVLSSGYNTRAGIKKYFQEKYNLTLSVRPPHEKRVIGKKLVLFVNAQILLGEPFFATFPKKAVEVYNRGTIKK
ncbi:MAG: hypothetical protein WCG73_01915 [Candidatus Moraniibacteriota bacterium]